MLKMSLCRWQQSFLWRRSLRWKRSGSGGERCLKFGVSPLPDGKLEKEVVARTVLNGT